MSDDRQALAIAEYVLGMFEKYKCVKKLLSQTYDRAYVMASQLNGLQAKIKETVPQAIFYPLSCIQTAPGSLAICKMHD